MIYILFIAIVLLMIFKPELAAKLSEEDILFMLKVSGICLLILPIWYGIREAVRELEKIRKLLEKAGESK